MHAHSPRNVNGFSQLSNVIILYNTKSHEDRGGRTKMPRSGKNRKRPQRGDGGNGASKIGPQSFPSSPVREPLQPGPTGVGVSLEVETVEPKRIGEKFVYSAKFLCGKIPHSPFDPQDPLPDFPLVPGTYRTGINVNNPNPSKVGFTKMALLTNPQWQGWARGKAGDPVDESLDINEGLEIDCQDIEKLLTQGGSGIELLKNSDGNLVFSDPPRAPMFTLNDPAVIKQIWTYHWNPVPGTNDGRGDPPGTIRLQEVGGAGYRSPDFPAQGLPGQNGVPNVGWLVDFTDTSLRASLGPAPLLQAGTYSVIDSKHQTWSFNQTTIQPNAGFAIVRGNSSFVGRMPFSKGFVVIRSDEEIDVVGVYTLKNVISSVPTTTPVKESKKKSYSVSLTVSNDSVVVGGSPLPVARFNWATTPPDPNISVEIQVRSASFGWVPLSPRVKGGPVDIMSWNVTNHGIVLFFRAVATDTRTGRIVAVSVPAPPNGIAFL